MMRRMRPLVVLSRSSPLLALRPLAAALLVAACAAQAPPAEPARGTAAPSAPAARAAAPPAAAPSGRAVAVTLDDLPVVPPARHDLDAQREITERLVAALAARGVPAIGFVNEAKLAVDGAVDPRRVALLERWLDAGFELGNHTFSHPDLHRVPLADFLAEIDRGDEVTARLLAARGERPRWFRHPFLHTGRDLETKRAVETFLAERGYRVAPVTIDNGEWIFAAAYVAAAAAADRETQERLGAAYLDYMDAVTAFYEGQARAIVDGELPQVLLLHANLLNADHLGALLDRLAARGYRFVPLAEALAHPAYARPDTYTGAGGITWLHRWAITAGVDRAVFAGEPEVPAWVVELAGVS
jgi:peptidoglycan/xylan/chitin deacetylase (PgdA/CDA1 family)